MNPAHDQSGHAVRFEWGPVASAAVPADVAVVVDVLSFTTTLTVAVERGIEVFPLAWGEARAASYALARDALVAVGRSQAGPGEVSLSPVSVSAAADDVRRLVLPSPNGSAICAGLASSGTEVYGACLRNRSAVGRALVVRVAAGASVTVVAAGERWPDGSLRPCVEDLWGAGAVLAALVDAGVDDLSVEARAAEGAFRAALAGGSSGGLPAQLTGCASGRELVAKGFASDVAVAGEVDASGVVPVLAGESFTAS